MVQITNVLKFWYFYKLEGTITCLIIKLTFNFVILFSRIHNIASGKLKQTYKGSQSEDGTLIKVELDPSGMYAATSCSDKTLAIFDFYSGACMATMMGHSGKSLMYK